MYSWYLRQRLSVKLVLPSVLIVFLLAIAGIYIFALAKDQQILQHASNTEAQLARKLSNLIESYSQTQSHLFKAVALSFAGVDQAKIAEEISTYIARQPQLQKIASEIADLDVFEASSNEFTTIQLQSKEYFHWVKQVAESLDDPGMAASNMVTTETKFNNLRKTLDQILNTQETRMGLVAEKTEASLKGLTRSQLIATLIVAIIAVGISLLNLRMFKTFVNKAKEDVCIIANGNFAHQISVTSGDELGELAMSVEQMRIKTKTLLEGLKTTASGLTSTSETLKDLSGQLTQDASRVDNRTVVISTAGRDVSSLADRMAKEAQIVSKGSASTAHSLEEMKSTILEIARNCNREVEMVQVHSQTTRNVIEGMNNLGTASKEIGSILKMINDIAGKTRLLALNATIEAASAGEAGKGFSVVAAEVKDLAVQSNSAASLIEQKIIAIQSQVTQSISASHEISHAMDDFSEISRTIAAAVEEQSAMVSEIAQAVADVSQSSSSLEHGMDDVSQKTVQVLNAIKDVGEVAASTAKEAQLTAEHSGRLNSIAAELSNNMSKFQV